MIDLFNTMEAEKFGVNSAIIIRYFETQVMIQIEIKKNYVDGRHWIYAPSSRIAEALPFFSEFKINRALKKLIDGGILLIRNINGDYWYAFADEEKREFPIVPYQVSF